MLYEACNGVNTAHCIKIKVTESGMVASKKVLPKEVEVTRSSIQEYAEEIKKRYRKATKAKKRELLNEFTQVTGLHRKSAIRLLNRKTESEEKKRRGRKKKYGMREKEAIEQIWEASDRLCSKRLKPFLPEMIKVMRRHGEIAVNAELEAKLCCMSTSTIDRLLRSDRKTGGRKGLSTTSPGTILKHMIPIRTFADWEEDKAGFMEIDLVSHCGETVEGFYLTTLCGVDIASGWTECLPVLGKGAQRVRSSVHRMRQRLPFTLLGIDSDNGSEFINQYFYAYCNEEKITFTRSRPYKKNDSCHVEQKNGNIVRRVVGYERYSSKEAYRCLDSLYTNLRLYVNFFQPTMKLLSKTRNGATVHKVYDTAKTPYQRLIDSGVLTASKRKELTAIYNYLNPVSLRNQIDELVSSLVKKADR
jgi:hypothetical protein